jgi:hypothetical protein
MPEKHIMIQKQGICSFGNIALELKHRGGEKCGGCFRKAYISDLPEFTGCRLQENVRNRIFGIGTIAQSPGTIPPACQTKGGTIEATALRAIQN